MGWLISIILFITALINGNSELIIASGLFAIAGAIGFKEFEINRKGESYERDSKNRSREG